MPLSADEIKDLHRYEYRILKSLEWLMKRYLWVPEDVLRKATKLSESEMKYRLGRLMEMDMVKSSTKPYTGYQLVFKGYDALAISSLVTKGTLNALGTLIGVGKESEVYEALGLGVLVIKIHRVGQRSFQSVRLNRSYIPEWKHFPWLFASMESAKMEFTALSTLQKNGVSVPIPIAINRNVIAMSFIPGLNLNQVTLEEPQEIFDEVVENLAKAYKLGFIHSDLSEFNIMVDEERVWLIDWPQWIEPSHPNADTILRRDIDNLVNYFSKKYGLSATTDEVINLVIG